MALIGSLVVKLVANAKGFEAEMNRSQKQLKQFGDMAAKPIALFGKTLQYPGQALQSVLQPIQSALSQIPLIGSGLAQLAGQGGFVNMFKDTAKEMSATQRQADSLGLSYGSLRGMQLLAGDAGDSVAKAMFKLDAKLGEMKSGNKEVAGTFAKLGFDGAKLASLPLDKAIGAIGDRLKGIHDPAERAAIAFELMGKHGFALMPFLLRGSDAMEAWKKKVEGKGLVPTADEIKQMRDYLLALKDLDLTMEGLKAKATVKIGLPIAKILDRATDASKDDWAALLNPLAANAVDPKAFNKNPLVEIFDALTHPGPHNVAEILDQNKRNRIVQGGGTLPVAVSEKSLEESRKQFELAEAFGKLNAAMNEELATMGKTHSEIERDKLVRMGATQSMLAQYDAQTKLIETQKQAAESLKKENDEIAKLYTDTTTPLEQFAEKITHLDELVNKGAISWDLYKRALGNVYDGLLKTDGKTELPKLMQAGSSEAVSASNKFRFERTGGDPIAKLIKAIDKQEQGDKRREQLLEILAGNITTTPEFGRVSIGR
jgi:hypothetical protein